jgi:hypothetical protein
VNEVAELISQVCRAGASIYAEPPDIFIKSPRLVPAELKVKLRERKPDVISYLIELQASQERLESRGISIAIFEDGSIHVVITQEDTAAAVAASGVIYSPQDMFAYVTLNKRERQLLQSFKKRFGGHVEWERR